MPDHGTSTDRRPGVFGLDLTVLTTPQILAKCRAALEGGPTLVLGVVDAAKAVAADRNPRLREALRRADIVVSDGPALVLAGRVLRRPVPERVSAVELMESLLSLANRGGHRVYVLGGRPHIVRAVVSHVTREHPYLVLAGYRDGYFTNAHADEVAAEIAASDADLLFVGVPSPKAELFVDTYGRDLGVRVVQIVGDALDVIAGDQARAPEVIERAGLTWAYRLAGDPKRVAPRVAKAGADFVALLAREGMRRTTQDREA